MMPARETSAGCHQTVRSHDDNATSNVAEQVLTADMSARVWPHAVVSRCSLAFFPTNHSYRSAHLKDCNRALSPHGREGGALRTLVRVPPCVAKRERYAQWDVV